MKLSEMNTEQMADAIVALADPMANITRDDELNKELSALAKKKGGTLLEQISYLFVPLVMAMLKRHRSDTYVVLAVLTGKTVKEIAEQKGLQTVKDAKECFDKELLDFFR